MPDDTISFKSFQTQLAALVNLFERYPDDYMRPNYSEIVFEAYSSDTGAFI